MTSIVALIGARSGSKSVRDKNIRLLGGHPMLAWSIRAAILAGIERVIVSTDSEQYAGIATFYGAQAISRPADLARDDSTDYDFVNHALYLPHGCGDADFIVHLRPTTPFRVPVLIESAVEALQENGKATALRSVEEMPESAYKCFEIENGVLKSVGSGSYLLDEFNNPRQSFPRTYSANGYVDVLCVAFIRQRGILHGERVMPFVTPPTIEIDSAEDMERAQLYALSHPEIVKRIFG